MGTFEAQIDFKFLYAFFWAMFVYFWTMVCLFSSWRFCRWALRKILPK